MAATSYSPLPTSNHNGYGSIRDPYPSTNYGAYDTGVGSLASHPYQYETTNYGNNYDDNQQPQSNDYSNSQAYMSNSRSLERSNTNYGTTQAPKRKNINNQQGSYDERTQPHQQSDSHLVRSEHQISNHIPKEQQQQLHRSQTQTEAKPVRSQNPRSKVRKTPPNSLPHAGGKHPSESGSKSNSFLSELKPTKSSTMRAAAIKKKEEKLAIRRHDQFFPSSENVPKKEHSRMQHENAITDTEQSDTEKRRLLKKQSHSVPKIGKLPNMHDDFTVRDKRNRNQKPPKNHKSRRDGYQTDDNKSAGDDDANRKRHRSKSQNRDKSLHGHHDKHGNLPPLRRGRRAPPYDPYVDYSLAPGHPMKGRVNPYDYYMPMGPYYGPYGHGYEDPDEVPPYLPAYRDPYDPFFDYEKRKAKAKRRKSKSGHRSDHEESRSRMTAHETDREDGAKSQQSRKSRNKSTHRSTSRKSRHDDEDNLNPPWIPGYYPPHYYHGRDMLETWRQERNDYLKKKYKPTVHDVLYSQQWMKADSYLENQRRRVLRDVQGYYFPYKKYTLRDYKDLQKVNNQNPFGDVNDTIIDRKERARKRQEYGSQVERQMVDNPGTRYIPPRDMPTREPWHLSNKDPNETDKSKRDRALEYAKVQVRYVPTDESRDDPYQSDHNERHATNHLPKIHHDGTGSNNERRNKTNQLHYDYKQ